MAEIGRIPDNGPRDVELTSSCLLALDRLLRFVRSAPPRLLLARFCSPLLLFLDGSADPSVSTESGFNAAIGGCLLDPSTRSYSYFGGEVPQRILCKWVAGGAKHVIAQAELLPALVSRHLFRRALSERPVLCFIDNESARSGLIKGSSRNEDSAEIIEEFVSLDMVAHAAFWFARVPSASNLADDPSRGRAPQSLAGWAAPERCALHFAFKPYGP